MIIILAIIGFVLSSYALLVVAKLNKYDNYKPLCDINEYISCSKAFLSRFGKGFGMPNPIIGLSYFGIIVLFYYFDQHIAIAYISVIGLLYTLFYAYLLYFKVRSFCIVRTAIHIINILLFYFSFF